MTNVTGSSEIMEKMQIREDDLIDVAYIDLLTGNSCKKEMG